MMMQPIAKGRSEEHPLLSVSDLAIDYQTPGGRLRVVGGVSFTTKRGEIFGLVGESGSGKSSVIYALMGYAKQGGAVAGGRVDLDGEDILKLPAGALRRLRGRKIGFVPQNPTTSLSPHLSIGDQMRELLSQHGMETRAAAASKLVAEHLRKVGLPHVTELMRRYPHELSGGQQQRVCIAMALICQPDIVLMDEPTTGLDVTTQAQIISLLLNLRKEFGMSIIYVTHDLGVLGQLADRVGVMYAGRLVEVGPTAELFRHPRHPYTRGLMSSIPSIEHKILTTEVLQGLLRRADLPPGCPFSPRCRFAEAKCASEVQPLVEAQPGTQVACRRWDEIAPVCEEAPAHSEAPWQSESREVVLKLEKLSVDPRPNAFAPGTRPIVPEIDLDLYRGELLALVGESGSGKTTVAKAISGLFPAQGKLLLGGEEVPLSLKRRSSAFKRKIQYIFQNPDASLNPRLSIWRSLSRPLKIYFGMAGREIDEAVEKSLADVSLDESYALRLPSRLSGGEKQRIAIARGLAAEPTVLLCDEVLSALDVSVQANIINLIQRLRSETDLSILFISHDLAVVREISDRVAVLFHGELVQIGPTASIFVGPYHPYTDELLEAVPELGRPVRQTPTVIPERLSDAEALRGCVFRARCRKNLGEICATERPPWRRAQNGSQIRCHIEIEQ
jgi:peptide/nickel transport system ATP-binding protein